jgi:hypothetical protein
MKQSINGITFTLSEPGKSRCEFCGKLIHNLLLKAHSSVHSQQLSSPAPLIPVNRLPPSPAPPSPKPVPAPVLQQPLALTLSAYLKIFTHFSSLFSRVINTHLRCVDLQLNHSFRKWRKTNTLLI